MASLTAIIFDLDGTLYRQGPLRRKMMRRLIRAHLTRPLVGVRTMRVLAAYRRAQEELRESQPTDAAAIDLEDAQIRLACERSGTDRSVVVACVARWMDREPLAYLSDYLQPGVVECLRAAKQQGLRLAVFSDYPAEAKLRAMGLLDFFDLALSAQSPDVGAFKPDPRGLQVAMRTLGVGPGECVYVGDRADVDGPTALAAGIPSFILGPGHGFDQIQQLVHGRLKLAQPVLDPA